MRRVVLHAQDWVSGPVLLATSFIERAVGLIGKPHDSALLIHSGSVHGFGLTRPLMVVGLTRDMRVLQARVLAPNRIVRVKGAQHILELPLDAPLPSRGLRLELTYA